jgi:hypothetical protein
MFDIANLSIGVIVLLLRVAVVFLLYFFLWQVVQVVARDVRRGSALAAVPASPYGQLIVTSAGQTGIPVGRLYPLSPVTIIGRSTECEVTLNDTFLSAEHARLERHEHGWVLEDLHSTNGTYLNGFEVRGAADVHDGDIIRVGRVELKLVTA